LKEKGRMENFSHLKGMLEYAGKLEKAREILEKRLEKLKGESP
jgi:hypothetical protein